MLELFVRAHIPVYNSDDMKRKLNVPAIFLCALAMGAWVGASLHTSTQILALSRTNVTCGSCCSLLASIAKSTKKTQIQATSAAAKSECGVCLAGALVYDAPAVAVVSTLNANSPLDVAPVLKTIRLSAHNHAHPPERGPPA